MIKESSKRTKRRTYREPLKSSAKAHFPIKPVIAAVIILLVLILRFFPGEKLSDTVFAISKTSSDFILMTKELGEVIKKHTVNKRDFIIPCDFEITSEFGERTDPVTNQPAKHFGIDYGAPLFTDVKCASDGIVKRVEENEYYGKFIMVDHGKDIETLYGHLKEAMSMSGTPSKKVK